HRVDDRASALARQAYALDVRRIVNLPDPFHRGGAGFESDEILREAGMRHAGADRLDSLGTLGMPNAREMLEVAWIRHVADGTHGLPAASSAEKAGKTVGDGDVLGQLDLVFREAYLRIDGDLIEGKVGAVPVSLQILDGARLVDVAVQPDPDLGDA